MVFVKLKPAHPGNYVKVYVDGKPFRVDKKGREVPDEYAEHFSGDALIIEGQSSSKKSSKKKQASSKSKKSSSSSKKSSSKKSSSKKSSKKDKESDE